MENFCYTPQNTYKIWDWKSLCEAALDDGMVRGNSNGSGRLQGKRVFPILVAAMEAFFQEVLPDTSWICDGNIATPRADTSAAWPAPG